MKYLNSSGLMVANRRSFLKATGGALLTGAAAGSGLLGWSSLGVAAEDVPLPDITSIPDSLKGSGEVRIVGYGGPAQAAQRKAIFEPFEKLSGIKVVDLEGADPNKVKAMVDAKAVEWDCVQVNLGQVIGMNNQGDYWSPINYDLIDTADIAEQHRGSHIAESLVYGQPFGYRTDTFKDVVPNGWGDFWDTEKFPGPRSMANGGVANPAELEVALMAAGVPPDQVYPIDIDKAFESLSRIKSSVVKWWDTGAIAAQLISNGEVVMATCWSGRLAALQAANAPIDISWKQAPLKRDGFAIPVGAPNKSNAEKLIAFTMMALPQARFSILFPYGFTNAKAAEYIPESVLAKLATAPDILKDALLIDYAWWIDNREKVIDKWNRWIVQ